MNQPYDTGWLSGLSQELQDEIISDSQPRNYTPWEPQEFNPLPVKSHDTRQGAWDEGNVPSITHTPSRPLTVTTGGQEALLKIDALPLLQVAERMTVLSKLIVQNCNQGIWDGSVQQIVGYLSSLQNELYNAISGRK